MTAGRDEKKKKTETESARVDGRARHCRGVRKRYDVLSLVTEGDG